MPVFRGQLNDFDKMPIGKWKGELLMDVPDGYYRWLRKQDWLKGFPALHQYVMTHDWGDDEFDDRCKLND